MTSFVAELRRRNVLKVAAAYALVSWILIEAGSVLLPTFGAPAWVFKAYILVVAAGFVVALVSAWVFEVTPEGVKLEKHVDRTASIADETGRKLNFGIIGLLAAALAVSVTLNITGLRGGDDDGRLRSGVGRSIAVLPFTSRSTDPENALFADGIHDDLLTTLANLRSLKVISRTSVLEYRDTTKNIRDIAAELGVDTVLEGAVQRAGSNVRINVQLIDAQTDEHLWARRFDRELTAKNIFSIQSEISEQIAAALKAQLTPAEQGRIASVPTENLEAYDLYTAGRNNLYKRRLETVELARTQFEQAIALDADYSQAWSGLADSLLLLFINHNAISAEEARSGAQDALDQALALDDSSADAYASLGLLKMNIWQQTRQGPEYDEAEAAFKRAIELSPNHSRALTWYAGLVNQDQRAEEAIAIYRKALELDPLSRVSRDNLAGVLAQMGRNDEALREALHAVRVNPDWPNAYQSVANQLAGLGRIDEAYAWAHRARQLSSDPLAGQTALGVLVVMGEAETAAQMLDKLPATHPLAAIVDGFKRQFGEDYAGALASWEAAVASGNAPAQIVYIPMSDAATMIGDYEKSLKYCLLQNPELEEPTPEITALNMANAVKLAFLLQKTGDPRRADKLLAAIEPVVATRPRLGAAGHGLLDVHVLALQGKRDEALARLRVAFEEGVVTTRLFENWSLRDTPYLESIRDAPEFAAVERDSEAAVARMHMRYLEAAELGDFEPLREIALSGP